MQYCQKLVSYGKFIEIYTYEKPQKKDYKKILTLDQIKKALGMPTASSDSVQLDCFRELAKTNCRARFSLQRTRTKIRRLINANPDFDKFLTLTFAENLQDIKIANRQFSLFIERLNYVYPNTKHLAVIEFQKRGAVHYHMLSNLGYVNASKISDIWKNGFVKINKIKNVDNVGAYVCKYLQKEVFEGKMKNKKKYFTSRNLDKPVEIFDSNEIKKIADFYGLSSVQPVYKSEFDSIYTGGVKYIQYAIN